VGEGGEMEGGEGLKTLDSKSSEANFSLSRSRPPPRTPFPLQHGGSEGGRDRCRGLGSDQHQGLSGRGSGAHLLREQRGHRRPLEV